MTGKTMAEHAREYRTRKAERLARMEAALREIAALGGDGEHSGDRHAKCRAIARAALAKPTNT